MCCKLDFHLAQQDFDEVIGKLNTLSKYSYKDNTLIMYLLTKKITLWTSHLEEDGGRIENIYSLIIITI